VLEVEKEVAEAVNPNCWLADPLTAILWALVKVPPEVLKDTKNKSCTSKIPISTPNRLWNKKSLVLQDDDEVVFCQSTTFVLVVANNRRPLRVGDLVVGAPVGDLVVGAPVGDLVVGAAVGTVKSTS